MVSYALSPVDFLTVGFDILTMTKWSRAVELILTKLREGQTLDQIKAKEIDLEVYGKTPVKAHFIKRRIKALLAEGKSLDEVEAILCRKRKAKRKLSVKRGESPSFPKRKRKLGFFERIKRWFEGRKYRGIPKEYLEALGIEV